MVLFTAIIGHSFNEEKIFATADFLNSTRPEVQHCLAILHEHLISKHGQVPWQWTIREGHSLHEDFQTNGVIVLDETNMFSTRVSKRLMCLYSTIRWSQFLREPVVNNGLRCLSNILASALDSKVIIYVPDSGGPPSGVSDLLYCEAGIEEAVMWLQTNCGPPAKTFEEIFPETADVVNENGYFIEFAAKSRS